MTTHNIHGPEPDRDRLGTDAAVPAITVDQAALRAWLARHADRLGIDESYSSMDITIAEGLVRLVYALDDGSAAGVWTMRDPLESVSVWPTADDDGVDGGALITADLRINGHPIRLACLHQCGIDFTSDEDTSGIDAAVQALTTVTELVNREITTYLGATQAQPGTATLDPETHAEDIAAVLNAVADDLLEVTGAGDEGLRDALTLTVNAAPLYLQRGWHQHDPAAARGRLEQVAANTRPMPVTSCTPSSATTSATCATGWRLPPQAGKAIRQ